MSKQTNKLIPDTNIKNEDLFTNWFDNMVGAGVEDFRIPETTQPTQAPTEEILNEEIEPQNTGVEENDYINEDFERYIDLFRDWLEDEIGQKVEDFSRPEKKIEEPPVEAAEVIAEEPVETVTETIIKKIPKKTYSYFDDRIPEPPKGIFVYEDPLRAWFDNVFGEGLGDFYMLIFLGASLGLGVIIVLLLVDKIAGTNHTVVYLERFKSTYDYQLEEEIAERFLRLRKEEIKKLETELEKKKLEIENKLKNKNTHT